MQTVATRSVVESGDGGSILIRSMGLKVQSGSGFWGSADSSGSCSDSDMSVPPAVGDRQLMQKQTDGANNSKSSRTVLESELSFLQSSLIMKSK